MSKPEKTPVMSTDKPTVPELRCDATAISTFQIFKSLGREDRTRISELMTVRDYVKDQFIISSNQRNTELYFILSGSVRACAVSENGKQVQFEDLSPGMMFGEFAAIDQQQRSSDCIALQDTRVTILSAEQFRTVLRQYPDVTDAVLVRLVNMIRTHMKKVFEVSTTTVNQRVRLEILRMASSDGEMSESGLVLQSVPTHADIAARISTHREAVSREIAALQADEVITWRSGKHIIHDLSRLMALTRE